MDTARRDALPYPPGDAAIRPDPTVPATPTAAVTGDAPSRRGSRRGALHAVGLAVLAALGLREAAAKQDNVVAESDRNRHGHGHQRGNTGKRGKKGAAGPEGSSGPAGVKGDKGDQGPGKTMLTATTPWQPGSLFPGTSSHTMVEVPGAAPGDPVVVGLSSINFPPFEAPALPIYGHVINPDLVAVFLTNLAISRQTVGDGTLTVVVIKP